MSLVSYTTIYPPPITTFSCSAYDGSLYTAASDLLYQLKCTSGVVGTDVGTQRGTDLLDCIVRCEAQSGCAATTWIPSTSTCYFKGADARYSFSDSVESAILAGLVGDPSLKRWTTSTLGRVRTSQSSKTTAKTIKSAADVTSSRNSTATDGQKPSSTTIVKDGPKTTSSKVVGSSLKVTVFGSSQRTIQTTVVDVTTSITINTSTETVFTTTNTPTNQPNKTSLTFLSMGDSITWGYLKDQPTNSYRRALYNLLTGTTRSQRLALRDNAIRTPPQIIAPLTAISNNVTAVGSIRAGNFSQNYCEGIPSAQIEQIRGHWSANAAKYPQSPDVVLILAGINDIVQNLTDASTAAAVNRLGLFIDAALTKYPNATVIVGTLTPVTIDGWKTQVSNFNKAVPSMVLNRVKSGKRVVMVDLHAALPAASDLGDWVHPSAVGYVKMAETFYDKILDLWGLGWI